MSKEIFRPKEPEELQEQLGNAEAQYGVPLYSSEAERDRMLRATAQELAEVYPLKYRAYKASLLATRRNTEPPLEVSRWIGAINKIERYIAKLDTESNLKLREHQQAVFDDLLDFFEAGYHSGYIKLPTGAGKTAIFLKLAEVTGLRTLILVPSVALVEQTIEKIQEYQLGLNASAYYSHGKNLSGQIVVCTYQSFEKFLRESNAQNQKYELIVTDEAHRSLTDARKKAVKELTDDSVVIALTATPDFNEKKTVRNSYGTLIHEMTINEAILSGILSGVRCVYLKTKVDLSKMPATPSGDYREDELEKILNITARNKAALSFIDQQAFRDQRGQLKRTVTFCISINHAERIAQMAQERGIAAEAIHSEQTHEERSAILKRYSNGQTRLLATVTALAEGWDEPKTEIILNLRPTLSAVLAEQRLGRGLRTSPGKRGAIVIDVLDFDESQDSHSAGRPITAPHILHGNVVFPPGLDDGLSGPGGTLIRNDLPDMEGVEAIVGERDVYQLFERLQGSDATTAGEKILKTLEDVRSIFTQAGYSSDDALRRLAALSKENFLKTNFTSNRFQGTGRSLLRRYFMDILGKTPPSQILSPDLQDFFKNVLGELRKHGRILNTPKPALLILLRRAAGQPVFEEALKIHANIAQSNQQPELATLDEFMQAYDLPKPEKGYTRSDFLQFLKNFIRDDARSDGESPKRNRKLLDQNHRITIQRLIDDLTAEEKQSKLQVDVCQIIREHPYLFGMTLEELKQSDARAKDGAFSVGSLLNTLKIKNDTELRSLLRVGFDAIEISQLRDRARESLKLDFEKKKFSRFITPERFSQLTFLLFGQELPGESIYTFFGLPRNPSREQFISLIDSIMDEVFAKPFSPMDPEIVIPAIKDSLGQQAVWPRFEDLGNVRLRSGSIDPNDASLRTLYDLVDRWNLARTGQVIELTRDDYERFKRVFKTALPSLGDKKTAMADLLRARMKHREGK
ncbi:DEAD/DEAH box helicase [Candidatus Berkelbacteria bacterium]|nr:DEAD/DEAH box helicase [Candidatus Berkelbacteria bacterium]